MEVCVVLGASRFIGKNLCPKLAKKFRVIAFDRYVCKDLEEVENIEQVTGNFTETLDFSPILEKVNIVYHLIGTALPKDGYDNITVEAEENVISTLRLLEQMVKCNVKRIIFASSGGTIYGERRDERCLVTDHLHPQCTYAVHKQVIKTYLDYFNRCTPLRCISVRLANPYGMGQGIERRQGVIPIFIYHLLHELPISILGDGTNKRDYIAMEDMVNALVLLAVYQGDVSTFNIGSGESHSLLKVIEMIEQISGRRFIKIDYAPGRMFDVSNVVLDIEETKTELSWRPAMSLEQGIAGIVVGYTNIREKKSHI